MKYRMYTTLVTIFLAVFLVGNAVLAADNTDDQTRARWRDMMQERHQMMKDTLSMMKDTMGILKNLDHHPSAAEKARLEEMMDKLDKIMTRQDQMMSDDMMMHRDRMMMDRDRMMDRKGMMDGDKDKK